MKIPDNVYLGLMCFLIGFSASSQDRWSAEFRPGINFPTDKIAGSELNTGFGFEASVAYNFIPQLGAYAGWSWNKFSAGEGFGTRNPDLEETGYSFGFQFIHPISTSSLSFLIRAGAVYNHLEIEAGDGNPVFDTGHGFGWQAEAGLETGIGSNWFLRPTLRYRSLPGEIEVYNGTTKVDLDYLSIGVGLAKKF